MSDTKLKICFFCTTLNGGIGRNLVRLANYYASEGYQTLIWAEEPNNGYGEELSSSVALIEITTTHALGGIFGLIRRVFQDKPDLIVTANERLTRLTYRAVRLTPFNPHIFAQIHASYPHEYANLKEKKKRKRVQRLRRIYPKLSGVIAVSKSAERNFYEFCGLEHMDNVVTIYNPVISDDLAQRTEVFECEKILPPQIVCVGHLEPVKDVGFLIKAFNIVRKNFTCELVIVGDGSQRKHLEKMANEIDFPEDVQFVGHAADPFPYMQRARVFAMSSHYEGFGNVVAEAFVNGTPVVSTDCGGPTEIISNDTLGEVVKTRTPEAYAQALLRWIDKPVDGQVLRQHAIDHYSVTVIAKQYLAYFKKRMHCCPVNSR